MQYRLVIHTNKNHPASSRELESLEEAFEANHKVAHFQVIPETESEYEREIYIMDDGK